MGGCNRKGNPKERKEREREKREEEKRKRGEKKNFDLGGGRREREAEKFVWESGRSECTLYTKKMYIKTRAENKIE